MSEKTPLRASASALAGATNRTSALEAEVAALRAQLSDQAEGHQSDMGALRAEQALRRAALEEALRAEAAESERRLCLQFAEEATAFKVQADISLQHSEASSRAACRREMSVLRAPLELMGGVILVCGPPSSGKTTRAESLATQLGLVYVSLAHLQESGAAGGGATEPGETVTPPPLSPSATIDLMIRAASCAVAASCAACTAHSRSLRSTTRVQCNPSLQLTASAQGLGPGYKCFC